MSSHKAMAFGDFSPLFYYRPCIKKSFKFYTTKLETIPKKKEDEDQHYFFVVTFVGTKGKFLQVILSSDHIEFLFDPPPMHILCKNFSKLGR